MTAGRFEESELSVEVERLGGPLEQVGLLARSAEARIQALIQERDALARANRELTRRIEVEIAGNVAHDFNNVLAVITGGLELLARIEQPERRARVMQRIEEAAWRGSDLVRRLRALARQSGNATQAESRTGEAGRGPILLPRTHGALEHLCVLIVEDDDKMAALAADMLGRLGHRGLRVSTVPAAVAALSGSEAVDLIFADVLLPGGGSGFDLAREIERRKLPLPIVLTSGFGAGVRGRLAAARLPFLPKPYTLAALQEVLQRAARATGPEVPARS